MSTAALETSVCNCTLWDANDTSVRRCPEHFHFFQGAKQLISVGRVIRECWPPPERPIDPAVMENARERGSQVDELFSAYVIGKLQRIPAGTRTDAVALFEKCRVWFDRQNFKRVESQIVLAAGDYCGVCDLRFDGMLVDLKSVYSLSEPHRLQVGGYCWLEWMRLEEDERPATGALLHVTERMAEPKLVEFDAHDLIRDWEITMSFHAMVKRGKP